MDQERDGVINVRGDIVKYQLTDDVEYDRKKYWMTNVVADDAQEMGKKAEKKTACSRPSTM